MKVKFVDYPKHYGKIKASILCELDTCLSKGDLILRGQTESFERHFADFVGVKHAIGLNSGTDALFFSLLACKIKKGDEIVTVSHTFVATIAAIVYCGAKPVLIDVRSDMNMDPDLIESAITEKTKAIIPVHLNGRCCDMQKIMKIASDHNLFVIEDAAQALGASCCKMNAGSIGNTGCFSFYPAKILGCAGDGGAVTTNDDELAKLIRLYRDHGYDRVSKEIKLYGYNSRLDNIQAAILDVKMDYLEGWIDRRREIAMMYHNGFFMVNELIIPEPPNPFSNYHDVYQNYVVRTNNRDALFQYLRGKDIETLISWAIPTHKHSALDLQFNLPRTEEISNTVISFPMYPEMTDEQVRYVIDSVRMFYA